MTTLPEVAPGQVVRIRVPLLTLPSGDSLTVPLVIAQGAGGTGPTLLVTANIHGNELTGLAAAHRLLERLEADGGAELRAVRGRLVVVPSLNPTGLMACTRYPTVEADDPNRKWPEDRPAALKGGKAAAAAATTTPNGDWLHELQTQLDDRATPQENAFAPLWALFRDQVRPDCHLDLHTADISSSPFIFLDRVLYDDTGDDAAAVEARRAGAQQLFERTRALVDAIGLTTLLERPGRVYVKKKLHRSTSGATLNVLRIPSCTIELGLTGALHPAFRDVGVAAVLRTMQHLGMLPPSGGAAVPLPAACPVLDFAGRPHRYMAYPPAPLAGVLDPLVDSGQRFAAGQTIAQLRDLDGSLLPGGAVAAAFDGWMVSWADGLAKHKGQLLATVAVEDRDAPTVVGWSTVAGSSE